MDLASVDLEKLANAIVILLVGIAGVLGFTRGRGQGKASPSEETHLEVAGALVDASSIKSLTGAIDGHTLALTRTYMAVEKLNANLERHGDQMEELGRTSEDLQKEVEEHRNEMARRR